MSTQDNAMCSRYRSTIRAFLHVFASASRATVCYALVAYENPAADYTMRFAVGKRCQKRLSCCWSWEVAH